MGIISSFFDWARADVDQIENQKWWLRTYNIQKKDAIAFWNMQNEYNSPAAQRARLEEAGLNPNLMNGNSASASLSTPSPSVPYRKTPSSNFDLWQMHLQKKQVEADVRARNAQTNRENETTEQLKMNNQILGALLTDKIETSRGDMFVQRIKQGWMEDHLREMLDAGLTEKEVRNDLTRIQKSYFQALTDKTNQSTRNLEQEFDHLKQKYGFEDWFYNQRLNPYAGGQMMPVLNALYSQVILMLESIIGLF